MIIEDWGIERLAAARAGHADGNTCNQTTAPEHYAILPPGWIGFRIEVACGEYDDHSVVASFVPTAGAFRGVGMSFGWRVQPEAIGNAFEASVQQIRDGDFDQTFLRALSGMPLPMTFPTFLTDFFGNVMRDLYNKRFSAEKC